MRPMPPWCLKRSRRAADSVSNTRIVNDPDASGQAVKSPYSNTFLVFISLNAFHEGSLTRPLSPKRGDPVSH